jgi:tetratricopeptide (TPR) repeat protein
MIGLSIMLAWSAADLIAWRPQARIAVIAATAAACAACVPIAWSQIQYWESTETLNLHALQVTNGNFILRHNLADYYLQHDRVEEARQQESDALRINPTYLEARLDLALALSLLGRPGEAEAEYRKGLELKPEGKELIVAHSGLGAALAAQHRTAEALPELELAVQLRPESGEGHYNLGTALAELGRNQQAASELSIAVRLEPNDAEAHHRLALALSTLGRMNEAAGEIAAVAKLRPGDAITQYNLGLALARTGHLDEAIRHFSEALRLRPDFTDARQSLQIAQTERDTPNRR